MVMFISRKTEGSQGGFHLDRHYLSANLGNVLSFESICNFERFFLTASPFMCKIYKQGGGFEPLDENDGFFYDYLLPRKGLKIVQVCHVLYRCTVKRKQRPLWLVLKIG